MSSECVRSILVPRSGTLAGTSLGDLLSVAAFVLVMGKFEDRCKGIGDQVAGDTSAASVFFCLPLSLCCCQWFGCLS